MSFFKKQNEQEKGFGHTVGELRRSLADGSVGITAQHGAAVFTTESLDETGRKNLQDVGNALNGIIDQSVQVAELDLVPSFESADGADSEYLRKLAQNSAVSAKEAATIAMIGGRSNPTDYVTQANSVSYSTEGADVVTPYLPGGDFDLGDLSASNLTYEAFEGKDFDRVAAWAGSWNLGAARQDTFVEAFFPTTVLNPDQNAYDMTINRTMTMRGVRRKLSGDPTDLGYKNILEAYKNGEMLKNQHTNLTPYRSSDDSNADKFIPEALFAPETKVIDGVEYITAPLAMNVPVDIMGVSQNPNVLEGTFTQTDQLDGFMRVDQLYMKVTHTEGAVVKTSVLKFNTIAMDRSQFVKSPTGDWMEFLLSMPTKDIAVQAGQKDAKGNVAEALAALTTAGYNLRFSVNVSGEANVQTGTVNVFSNKPTVVEARTKATGEVIDHKSGAVAALLAKMSFEFIAFDGTFRRTNGNRRTQGLLIDRNVRKVRYVVPIGAPISVQTTLNEAEDTQSINDLINGTRLRNSIIGVDTIHEKFNALLELKRNAPEVFEGKRIPESLEGPGKFLCRPFVKEIELDVYAKLQSLSSGDRIEDLNALLCNTIRDAGNEMMIDMNYLPVLATYTQGAETRPHMLVGTDLNIPQYLMTKGDPRSFGPNLDATVVASPQDTMENYIYLVFSRMNRQGPDPLSFGSHFWIPELVQIGQVYDAGANIKQLTVSPRNIHTMQLPGMARIKITNLQKALTELVNIPTKEQP